MLYLQVSLPPKKSFTHELALSENERAIYDRIFTESRYEHTILTINQSVVQVLNLRIYGFQGTPSSLLGISHPDLRHIPSRTQVGNQVLCWVV